MGFKATFVPKNLWIKFLSKSSEKKLSNKSKYLYQVIAFYSMIIFSTK